MNDLMEIFAAVLAVYGTYRIIGDIREWVVFPIRIRRMVRAALTFSCDEAEEYARYLQNEKKISSEPLIILSENDIMEAEELAASFEAANKDEDKDSDCADQ